MVAQPKGKYDGEENREKKRKREEKKEVRDSGVNGLWGLPSSSILCLAASHTYYIADPDLTDSEPDKHRSRYLVPEHALFSSDLEFPLADGSRIPPSGTRSKYAQNAGRRRETPSHVDGDRHVPGTLRALRCGDAVMPSHLVLSQLGKVWG